MPLNMVDLSIELSETERRMVQLDVEQNVTVAEENGRYSCQSILFLIDWHVVSIFS